ncbi:DNA topoisomerase [Cupriavidus malaysiensis]|uniref:DNA topoisomerase n=1 Tax=Cupriavidus malaysiensis TaxID=367825 RepID=A0ABM6FGL1_9BURK|nr:DNA topoisomerase [Cupriavidus malaysiensis]AOZ11099.1 hypothetical protein BKK80_34635 [Cupriavidus malaysiensis]
MAKQLIITEKPSVAKDIAAALGGFSRKDGYYESDRAVIAPAQGHLVEIVVPNDHATTLSRLPVIPPAFGLEALPKTTQVLKNLVRQINRPDVDAIVNACDAGREGELIFRRIVSYAKSKKPIQRLWLQSMTAEAIRTGMKSLRSDAEMIPLATTARSRAEADWIVGINGSRVMACLTGVTTPVGRVQTPVLMLTVEREEAIRNFVPRQYFEVRATIGLPAGSYVAKYHVPDDQRAAGEAAERLWDRATADTIVAACGAAAPSRIVDTAKPVKKSAPSLFDLTTLQREANKRFGFSAKETLDIAQALYDRHKALTYPRTDAKALPEDYVDTVKKTVAALGEQRYQREAGPILANDWVKPTKRVFDNKKISDHFAIIPTGALPADLSDAEAKIYDLVVRRFLAIFYPDAERMQTRRETTIVGHLFVATGSVLRTLGWLAVYGETDGEEGDPLATYSPGDPAKTESVQVHEGKTQAPSRFTEAALLAAMETAGKDLEDADLRDAMAERGLGTPATRAATIEKLLGDAYLTRVKEKKSVHLVPTDRAFGLRDLLVKLDAQALMSAQTTGEWEHQLLLMQSRQYDRQTFMQGIKDLTTQLVTTARERAPSVKSAAAAVEAVCPSCGGQLEDDVRTHRCASCDFSIWKTAFGRALSPEELTQLLTQRRTDLLSGFISTKTKRPFSAYLVLNDEFKVTAEFPPREAQGHSGSREGKICPQCGAPMRLRPGRNGQFWGCTAYPTCKHTENAAVTTKGAA